MLKIALEVWLFFLVGFICFDLGWKLGKKYLWKELSTKYIILEKGSYRCFGRKSFIKGEKKDAK
jgi:hypothetical protein